MFRKADTFPQADLKTNSRALKISQLIFESVKSLKRDVGFSSKIWSFCPIKLPRNSVLRYDRLKMTKSCLFVTECLGHKKAKLSEFETIIKQRERKRERETSYDPLIEENLVVHWGRGDLISCYRRRLLYIRKVEGESVVETTAVRNGTPLELRKFVECVYQGVIYLNHFLDISSVIYLSFSLCTQPLRMLITKNYSIMRRANVIAGWAYTQLSGYPSSWRYIKCTWTIFGMSPSRLKVLVDISGLCFSVFSTWRLRFFFLSIFEGIVSLDPFFHPSRFH